jgi:hypothetical protein
LGIITQIALISKAICSMDEQALSFDFDTVDSVGPKGRFNSFNIRCENIESHPILPIHQKRAV